MKDIVMTMDKMKLYLKCKANFGPDGYFRKAHTYLTHCMDVWLNLLYLLARCPDNELPVICIKLFHFHFKIFLDWT